MKDKSKEEVWVWIFKTHADATKYVEEAKLSNSQIFCKFTGKAAMGKAFKYIDNQVSNYPDADIIIELPKHDPYASRGVWFSPTFDGLNPLSMQLIAE